MNMQFRRSGQRDERRRRVIIEESSGRTHSADAADANRDNDRGAGRRGGRRHALRYPTATLTDRQPRMIAAIPTGWCPVISVLAAILAAIAGLEAMYGRVALGQTPFTISMLPAIDLDARTSLATWGGSLLLMLTAQLGILTYFIRRHRLDDYRGRYRMWYWVIPALFVAGIDQVAGLQESVRSALLVAAGIPNYADAQLVGLGIATLLVAVVMIRLAIEVRESRLALLSLTAAAGCYAVVALAGVRWLLVEDTVFRSMAVAGLRLGGHAALFAGLMFNARYIYRDAEGRIRRKRNTRKQVLKRSAQADKASARTTKTDRKVAKVVRRDAAHKSASASRKASDSTAPAPAQRKAKKSANPKGSGGQSKSAKPSGRTVRQAEVSSKTASSQQPADESHSAQKLSKAERRKQRKQRRQQRHAA